MIADADQSVTRSRVDGECARVHFHCAPLAAAVLASCSRLSCVVTGVCAWARFVLGSHHAVADVRHAQRRCSTIRHFCSSFVAFLVCRFQLPLLNRNRRYSDCWSLLLDKARRGEEARDRLEMKRSERSRIFASRMRKLSRLAISFAGAAKLLFSHILARPDAC